MAIEVLEIHHHAVRIDDPKADEVRQFYNDVLGLPHDTGRPNIPGIPGYWINVGDVGQLHLIGGPSPSRLSQGPGKDPAGPHVALAVKDVVATKAEFDRMGVKYWSIQGVTGPDAEQLFVQDPCGNIVELHQYDKCRCRMDRRAPK